MPCSLPQELLDLIIDHLHDESVALKACCLISKACAQHARKYLFIKIEFHIPSLPISQWKEAFLDPTNSPAHYTRTLSIHFPQSIDTADVDTLLTFCGVTRLNLHTITLFDGEFSLAPLCGIFPAIRSLHLTFNFLRSSQVFGLICSFPLLEDLSLIFRAPWRSEYLATSPSSPRLTGTLRLHLDGGTPSAVNRLLDLPNGLHFRRIMVTLFSMDDFQPTRDLVTECSGTLESLNITTLLSAGSCALSIDLSNATKLQDIEFFSGESDTRWIAAALHTVRFQNIRQIAMGFSRQAFLEMFSWKCSHLDALLVNLPASHPLRVKIMHQPIYYPVTIEKVARLLPQSTNRGIIEVVECSNLQSRLNYNTSFMPIH